MKIQRWLAIIREHRFFFLLLILGMVIRVVMASGVSSPDSYFYTQHAADLLQGKFNMGIQTYVDFYRYAVWMPITLCFYLFGINDFSALLWPFFCGAGCLVVIYLLGSLLFNRKTALLAVFILAFLPMDIIAATQILPDMVVEFLSALAIFLFLRNELKSPTGSKILYLIVGILMGLAINARGATAILGIAFVIYMLWKRVFKWLYLFILGGIILVVGGTYLLSWLQTGNPFFEYRIHTTIFQGLYQAAQNEGHLKYFYLLSPYFYSKALLGISRYGLAHFSFFFYLFLAAVIFSVIEKRKEVILPMIWIVPAFLYLQFGAVDLKNFIPIPHEERYLSLIIMPAVLVTGFFLKEWGDKDRGNSRLMVWMALLFFALTSLYGKGNKVDIYLVPN